MTDVSRRWLLRCGAASIALPPLASLAPRSARAQAVRPVRVVALYVPNGIVMDAFRPTRTGEGYDLPPILAPLAPIQGDVSVLSGLTQWPARASIPGDHARGTSAFLTCRTPIQTPGADLSIGISMDQVIAQAHGDATPLPSLELGLEGGSNVGLCDSGYACAYQRNISWAGPSTPRPKIADPALAFDRLFGGTDLGRTEAERARRRALRASVLDLATGQAADLRRRLSTADVRKLDEYLEAVRALERRLQDPPDPTCDPGDRPAPPVDVDEAVRSMNAIIALALRCDLTRVVTFMFANGASNRAYDFLGVSGAHHEISHHRGDPEKIAALTTIDTWEVALFADLVARLAVPDPETGERLLDDTLVFFSSEVSDGNRHNHDDLPVLLAGSGGGAHLPGRHLVYDDVPIANLFTSLIAATGLPPEPFGDDGTGPLPDLAG